MRAVARQNIKVAYDPDTGFFGSEVKGSKYQFTVSEYDRILLVSRDGSFKIIAPEDKVLFPSPVIHAQIFDPEEGVAFTVVYRDKDKIAWGKKIHIKAFIRDREYELIKGKTGRVDYLIPGDCNDTIHVDFVPMKRQRVHEAEFDLSVLEVIGVTARGRRLAPKPASKVRRIRTNGNARGRDARRDTRAAKRPRRPAPALRRVKLLLRVHLEEWSVGVPPCPSSYPCLKCSAGTVDREQSDRGSDQSSGGSDQ